MKYDLNDILRFIVGVVMALTMMGIVGVVLYSLVFVTQPMAGQAPNDAEFFKLITPIANFIVGALAGVMASAVSSAIKPKGDKEDKKEEVKDVG